MSETTPFGEALLGIMGRRGFNRADIVRRTGYSFSRVTRLLNGGIKINAEAVHAIAWACKLSDADKCTLMRAAALTHGFVMSVDKNDEEAAVLYAVVKEALSVFAGQPLSPELTERMLAKLTAYAAIADQLLDNPESNNKEQDND